MLYLFFKSIGNDRWAVTDVNDKRIGTACIGRRAIMGISGRRLKPLEEDSIKVFLLDAVYDRLRVSPIASIRKAARGLAPVVSRAA